MPGLLLCHSPDAKRTGRAWGECGSCVHSCHLRPGADGEPACKAGKSAQKKPQAAAAKSASKEPKAKKDKPDKKDKNTDQARELTMSTTMRTP